MEMSEPTPQPHGHQFLRDLKQKHYQTPNYDEYYHTPTGNNTSEPVKAHRWIKIQKDKSSTYYYTQRKPPQGHPRYLIADDMDTKSQPKNPEHDAEVPNHGQDFIGA